MKLNKFLIFVFGLFVVFNIFSSFVFRKNISQQFEERVAINVKKPGETKPVGTIVGLPSTSSTTIKKTSFNSEERVRIEKYVSSLVPLTQNKENIYVTPFFENYAKEYPVVEKKFFDPECLEKYYKELMKIEEKTEYGEIFCFPLVFRQSCGFYLSVPVLYDFSKCELFPNKEPGMILKSEFAQMIDQKSPFFTKGGIWGDRKVYRQVLSAIQSNPVETFKLEDPKRPLLIVENLIVVKRQDYANLYHMLGEWVQVFSALKKYDLLEKPEKYQIVFMDEWPSYMGWGYDCRSLTEAYEAMNGNRKVISLYEQKELYIEAKRSIYPASGYDLWLATRGGISEELRCGDQNLLNSLASYMMKTMGFHPTEYPKPLKTDESITVRFLWNSRNYGARGKRVLFEEEKIFNALQKHFEDNENYVENQSKKYRVFVKPIISDLGNKTMRGQVNDSRNADILAAIHGAV